MGGREGGSDSNEEDGGEERDCRLLPYTARVEVEEEWEGGKEEVTATEGMVGEERGPQIASIWRGWRWRRNEGEGCDDSGEDGGDGGGGKGLQSFSCTGWRWRRNGWE